jgi:hypothetical protein
MNRVDQNCTVEYVATYCKLLRREGSGCEIDSEHYRMGPCFRRDD